MSGRPSPPRPYAELHCHTNFSFLDGASAADELVDRAVELGLSALAVTDHQGLYGVVRFSTAAREAGIHPVIGLELELLDAFAPDPGRIVVPAGAGAVRRGGASAPTGRSGRPGRRRSIRSAVDLPVEDGMPGPASTRADSAARPPGPGQGGSARRSASGQRGPHLVLLARDRIGYRSLCRLVSRANLAGTKGVPRFSQALLAEHAEGLVALSGCRDGEIARRLRVGDREGARAVAEGYARLFGRGREVPAVRAASARLGPGRAAVRRAAADGDRGGRLRPRARAPPPARRRLARGRDRPAGRGARPPGRRHERRPLRDARGSRAPGRRHGDPPRPVGRDAGRPPATRRRVLPEVRGGADGAAAGRSGDGRRRSADRPGLGGGDRGGR